MIRRDVIYSGRVQGVGFRWTTKHISSNYCVTGSVENREDGTVFLAVEGEEDEVDAFMQAIATRMKTNIRETLVNEGRPIGADTEFKVRY